MINYVLGFYFSPDMKQVVLIEKAKPEWQAGHLNGVGGKIEDFEWASAAMVREFEEETSVKTEERDWKWFGEMSGDDWFCYMYHTKGEEISQAKTTEDEKVLVINVEELRNHKTIGNLQWIIPALVYGNEKYIKAEY